MSRGGEYDAAITIFSPEGRIYQVEYALELVKRGAPVVGVKSKEGVVLAAVENQGSKLEEAMNSKKIFEIDHHLGAAIAGLSPDARILIQQARYLCQGNKITYDEPMDIEDLTSSIGDRLQQYTQYGGVRPYGVSIIVGGVDFSGPALLSVDPTGSYRGYKAIAIGRNSDQAKRVLEDNYRKGINLNESIGLSVEALKAANSEDLHKKNLKIAVIPMETKIFRRLSEEEIQKYIKGRSNRSTSF